MTLSVVVARSDDGGTTASFVPEAGMLCCAVDVAGRERLDQRRGVERYRREGKTMGVPLLYPWANRLGSWSYAVAGRRVQLPHDPRLVPSEEHDLPIHGVVPALMAWDAEATGARVRAHLSWTDHELLELFPFKHEVRLEAEVHAGSVTITTTVTASVEDPVPVSFGFHPYLRLPAAREQCAMRLPRCRWLDVDEQAIPTGERRAPAGQDFALAGGEWDDGLAIDESPACFTASGAGSSVTVELIEGFAFGQVFAPREREFICFEPMTAPANALRSGDGLRVLDPGEEHRASFRISWRDG